MSKHSVELYVYDLSKGLASAYSPLLIGKKIDGIWHTSIVVYGREYFFGSNGVESCEPSSTLLGEPLQKLRLGETEVPYSIFKDYVQDLNSSAFRASTYNLFRHNCNNFTDELAQFLVGKGIPKYILDLPNEVLQARLGPFLETFVGQLEQGARSVSEDRAGNKEPSPDYVQLNSQIEEARSENESVESDVSGPDNK